MFHVPIDWTRFGQLPDSNLDEHEQHTDIPRATRTKDVQSLSTKMQTTKFSSANFQEMLSPSYIISRIQRLEGKPCRSR